MRSSTERDTTTPVLWLAGVAFLGVALGLHLHRPRTRIEVGADLFNALRRRDAQFIAEMFPAEELKATGISREKARQIVERLVMPDAGHLSDNVVRLSIDGSQVAFEKPRSDREYFHPPKLEVIKTAPGVYQLSLFGLTNSVWGHRKSDFLVGLDPLDPEPRQRKEMQWLKDQGVTLAFDWSTHEARPIP